MHTFKDKNNTDWIIDLDLSIIRRFEANDFQTALGKAEPTYITFFPAADDLFTSILTNTNVVFEMIWLACKDQAIDEGVTDIEEFAKLFKGETIDSARMAFYEELPPFFPEKRTSLQALIESYSVVMEEADSVLKERVSSEMDRQVIRRKIKKMLEEAEAKETKKV